MALPATLTMGKGTTMTFNGFITRVEVGGGPGDEVFFVPPHWHETHDELFRVVEGRVEVAIGGSVRTLTPGDGEVRVPRGVVHSFKGSKGVRVVAEEWTDPMDGEKELFFRNLLSDGTLGGNFLRMMNAFYHGDTYVALPGHFMALEKMLTKLLGYYIAPFLGYERKLKTL